MKTYRALRSLVIAILGLLLWQAGDARASAFTVTPVRVLLGPNATSALLTVRNDSTDPLRFRITLRAWNQGPEGDIQLSDTNDIIFFPTLMELQPGEEKKVRVGSAFKSPVITERSYRIFFEELPPPRVADVKQQPGAEVKVLTKMGVPIFLQPSALQLRGELNDVSVSHGEVAFDVHNSGNSFFTLTSATLTGFAKDGSTTFTKTQDGWYVLAGGVRKYKFEIPADACGKTDRIHVEVGSSLSETKGSSPLAKDVSLQPGACTPATAGK